MIDKIRFSIIFLLIFSLKSLQAQQPNIIFILTDDQGYGDLGCNGNPNIKTPKIDKLYTQSQVFTDFHVGTTCAPSRAGLMSGQFSNKVGVWHTINGREVLNKNTTTLAQILASNGYETAIFGKWHLGDNYPFRPQDKGFKEALIHGGGGVGQQPDYWDNDYFDDTYFRNGKAEKHDGYCTDVWFDETQKFILKNKEKPFFAYVSLNAPHGPYEVPKAYADKYANNKNIPNPEFYGMIDYIDGRVGKLRDFLKSNNLDQNTVLIFMTDNGTAGGVKFDKSGNLVAGYNANMRGTKGSNYEGGHRVPFLLYQPNKTFEKDERLTSYVDVMPTILDICKIKYTNKNLDGKSLVNSKNKSEFTERKMVVDTQRELNLEKWKSPCVMYKNWRLTGQNELYDLSKDPGQKENIATQNPKMVAMLKQEYEKWWTRTSVAANEINYIEIGTLTEVALHAHSSFTDSVQVAWNQNQVRQAIGGNGTWFVEVSKDGTYEILPKRWPKESGLKNTDIAPKGEVDFEPIGKKLNITESEIKVTLVGSKNKNHFSKKASAETGHVVNLKKGRYQIEANFFDAEGVHLPVYYCYITSK